MQLRKSLLHAVWVGPCPDAILSIAGRRQHDMILVGMKWCLMLCGQSLHCKSNACCGGHVFLPRLRGHPLAHEHTAIIAVATHLLHDNVTMVEAMEIVQNISTVEELEAYGGRSCMGERGPRQHCSALLVSTAKCAGHL